MRILIESLKQNLLDRIELLLDLISGQEQIREFLIRPEWDAYFSLLRPQQDRVAQLRDKVREQRTLTMKLAQTFGLNPRTPMVQLLEVLSPEDRDVLLPLFEASRKEAEKLRSLSKLSERLFEAQNTFTTHWVESWKNKKPDSLITYNAFGYHVPKSTISVFHQDA